MEKYVRISKYILIIVAQMAFGQDAVITVDGEMVPINGRSSIISQFDSLLVEKGEFGGILTLVDFDPSSGALFNYQTHNDRKTIDEILFKNNMSVNTPVLLQIFSNLTKAYSYESAQTIVNELRTGYPFIPQNLHFIYGLMKNDRLGVLVDFNPEFNSYFSGIAGAGRQDEREWNIAGEIDIHLENTWHTANITDLVWKRNGEDSQYILFKHEEPYLVGLPFGAKIELIQDLRNREYMYTNSSGAFSMQLGPRGKWYFGGGQESIKPTALGDSLWIEPFEVRTFNVEYFSDGRNDRWLPTNGFFLNMKSQTGIENTSNQNDNLVARIQLHFEEFITLSHSTALRIKYWNGLVWDKDNDIHVGQKIRYGGMNTFRGYQEDIFASDIINIFSLDALYTPTKQFQLFAFGDMSIPTIPMSLGFGFRQRSANSVMEVNFGWPTDEAFSRGKVHVKFTSLLD